MIVSGRKYMRCRCAFQYISYLLMVKKVSLNRFTMVHQTMVHPEWDLWNSGLNGGDSFAITSYDSQISEALIEIRALISPTLSWLKAEILTSESIHPKNPCTLEWKGLNLYSRGPGPQNSHFWGVRILRVTWNLKIHSWKRWNIDLKPIQWFWLAGRAIPSSIFFLQRVNQPLGMCFCCNVWTGPPVLPEKG